MLPLKQPMYLVCEAMTASFEMHELGLVVEHGAIAQLAVKLNLFCLWITARVDIVLADRLHTLLCRESRLQFCAQLSMVI